MLREFTAQLKACLTSERPQPWRRNAGKTYSPPRWARCFSLAAWRARNSDGANELMVLKRSEKATLVALCESCSYFRKIGFILWQRAESWGLFVKRQQTHKTIWFSISGRKHSEADRNNAVLRLVIFIHSISANLLQPKRLPDDIRQKVPPFE